MTARRASAGKKSALRAGCLETAAIVVFALVLGAFAASTWMRHVGGEEGRPPTVENGDSLSPPPVERARIRVQVRNASGIPGAAAHITEYLRDAGFDVVDFGNAEESDRSKTIVIDRLGSPGRAREVAAALQGVPIQSAIDKAVATAIASTRVSSRKSQRALVQRTHRARWRSSFARSISLKESTA